jgi:hypothetical protein
VNQTANGLQQRGERGHVTVFECRTITFDERQQLAVLWFGDVLVAWGDLGEVCPCALQGAVDRRRCGLEQFGHFGGAELDDVAQDQHRPLTRRELLQRRDDGQPDALPGGDGDLGRERVGNRFEPGISRLAGVDVHFGVDGTRAESGRQHPAGAVLQRAQARGGRDAVQPGPQRRAPLERLVATPAAQIRLLDQVLGVLHRTEHAVTVRDQLGTIRRRLFDEILLGRHGGSPTQRLLPSIQKHPAARIHRGRTDESRWCFVSDSI